ncbi:MAG TPA: DUF2934 domain-containing protein [Acetobacteraceae bacterium]|nr:DUF2934 domain-containing protein [Acetobacteraceae bacterium]
MAENPLEDTEALEKRIRERATHLWVADGRPPGRAAEYWERARELIGIEDNPGAGQLPNPASLPGADPNREQPVEEAFIQENLGEFPTRLTDQGDRQQTPSPRRKRAPAAETSPETGAPPESGGAAAPTPGGSGKQATPRAKKTP